MTDDQRAAWEAYKAAFLSSALPAYGHELPRVPNFQDWKDGTNGTAMIMAVFNAGRAYQKENRE